MLSAHAGDEAAAARAELTATSSPTADLAGEVCFSARDCVGRSRTAYGLRLWP